MTDFDFDFDVLGIDDDRQRHPYVAEHPKPDPSVREWTNTRGEEVTREQQAWESRSGFHAIEGLLGALTPLGLLYVAQAALHRLTPMSLAQATGTTWAPDALEGPMLAEVAFETLFSAELDAAVAWIDQILERCPSCGRRHGEIGWIHTQTGKAVRVDRVESDTVWFSREYAPGQWTAAEPMPRASFERWHVPADQVSLLGEEGSR